MVKLAQIIEFIENRTSNTADCLTKDKSCLELIEIIKPSDLIPGDPKGISFCLEKHASKLSKTSCPAIIIPKTLNLTPQEDKTYVRVNDPKSVFIDVCDTFFPSRIVPTEFIHSTAIIDSESTILEGTRVGAYSVIYKSQVGKNCLIYPGVIIYHAQIGNNVVIKPGTVIGYDGFGYYPVGDQIKKVPHYCKVIIEDDVDIGANVTIDRGVLSDTIIRKEVKIDNLVHIAHGDEIGEQVIITAGVSLGGSAKVGKGTWLGIGAVIKNGIKVGKKAFVAMGAVVNQDVLDEKKVIGNLAIDRDIFIRNLKKSLEQDPK